jgi:enediyne biosynthesis protein E4
MAAKFSSSAARWTALGALAVAAALVAVWFGRPVPAPITLIDVSGQTGITFRHTDGAYGQRYIMETVTAGLALFDYDGDGLIDIYLLNGAPLSDEETAAPPRNALYRNLGNWTFVEVTDQAGVGDTGYGLGVTVGDYNNDGYPDLFVNNFGPNVLYRNNGDGTFTEVTAQAGVAGGDEVGAGAAFLDADGDGHLDLYVANYLEFSREHHVSKTIRGVPVYVSPKVYPPAQDRFYRNQGDGTFVDATDQAGIGGHAGWGMGMVAADFDNDGDTDVFVANDVAENFLFVNDGTGRFEEAGLLAGVAYDLYGSPQGSMGVDCGDFDNDGWLDFYQTSYQLQHAVLFRNLGDGQFEDVTLTSGAGAGTYAHVTWGVGLVDFDNDGHRDLFVACGHLQDRVEEFDPTTSYAAANLLLRNLGDGRFEDISATAGDGMRVRQSSRGAAFDDLDGDGRVDAVILNSRTAPTVLRNVSRTPNYFLQIELVGTRSPRDGVGAQVRVTAGDQTWAAEVHSGRGYQSHFGSRLQFGLGSHRRADRIEVRWPSGEVTAVDRIEADRRMRIIEGRGGFVQP